MIGTPRPVTARLAAAPISWGICEVPGWGPQLSPERVLGEMRQLGITATELGAIGWLPTDPARARDLLDRYGLSLIGGFVPLVLHDPARSAESLESARATAATLAAAGGRYFVTAVVSSLSSWDRPALDAAAWSLLLANLDAVDAVAADHGLVQAVHPHVNTLIETAEEFERFVAGCAARFTLDTGHLLLGGADPLDVARRHHDRTALVHIKDVDARVAARLGGGELSLMEAVIAGLFPSAGQGSAPIAATVTALEDAGYDGWYVLEQDVSLTEIPAEGAGPSTGVQASIEYLQSLDA